MGAPAYSLEDLDFDNQDDPELQKLIGGAANDNADPPEDDSDLFDPLPANDNGGDLAATPEQQRAAQAAYEAEHPDEVGQLRELGFDDPTAPEGPSKIIEITEAGGGPIQIEGDPTPEPLPPKSGLQLLAEGAADTARGAAQGATMRWGDEGAAALAEAAPREGSGLDALARRALGLPAVDPEAAAIPRQYAAGSRYADMRDTLRAENRQAQERSPWLYGIGEVAGAAPGAIATAPAAGGALPARIAANMAAGGVYGGISGAGGSEAQDAVGVSADALQGAEMGALLGGGLTATAAGVGKVAQAARPGLERLANRARAGASGAYGGELARLTERHGPQYAEQLGADIERMGLHKRPGGAVANLLPSTPGVYRANAEQARKQLGAQLKGAIGDATEQGVTAPTDEVIAGLRAKLRTYPKTTPEGRAVREQIRGLMRDVGTQHGPYMTPQQLQALKKAYEAEAGFRPTQNMPAGDARTAQMYRKAASVPRKALEASVREQALPETAAQFANAKQDFGVARTVENLARKREAQEAGNMLVSLPAAATGNMVGAATMEGIKRVGKDVVADVARAGANQAGRIGTAADVLSGARAGVGAQAAPVGQAAGTAATAGMPGSAVGAMAEEKQRQAEATANAQGHRLEATVRDVMARNPQTLGAYSQRIQEAMESEDKNALPALLYQLSNDETWRTQFQPWLTASGER